MAVDVKDYIEELEDGSDCRLEGGEDLDRDLRAIVEGDVDANHWLQNCIENSVNKGCFGCIKSIAFLLLFHIILLRIVKQSLFIEFLNIFIFIYLLKH